MSNPFDQFDAAPGADAANPFDQFDQPAAQDGVQGSDYARAAASGVGSTLAGTGWLAEKVDTSPARSLLSGFGGAGRLAGKVAGAVSGGLQEFGTDVAEFWTQGGEEGVPFSQGMSQAARDEMAKEFIVESEDGLFGYDWGDASWHTAGLAAAQSLPGTIAGGGVGGALTKGLQLASVPARAAGVIGYGAGEATVAAGSAGKQTFDEVMAIPDAELAKHPEYQDLITALPGGLTPQKAADVKKRLANMAANQAAATTAGSTFVLSAPMGALMGKILSGVPIATTKPRAMATAIGGEMGQEFVQSGAEKLSQNVAIQQHADESQPLMQGVLNEAVGGSLSGGIMGVPMGLAAKTSPAPGEDDLPATPEADADSANVLYGEDPDSGRNALRNPPGDSVFTQSIGTEPGIQAEYVPDLSGETEQIDIVDQPIPESSASLEAQVQAFEDGRKPALLFTPGETPVIPEGAQASHIPGHGILVYRDPATLEAALDGRIGQALGYGIEGKPTGATDVITARDENGTVIQDVVTDGRPEVEAAAAQIAGPGGSVEQRPADQAITERLEYADPRLKRESYRKWLEASVQRDMEPNGGMFSTTNDRGQVDYRSPSVNPPWVQDLLEAEGVSVKYVRKAAEKAVRGEKLGPKQKRVVQSVLDNITGERTDEQSMALAKQRRLDALNLRRVARAAQPVTAEDFEQIDRPEYYAEDAIPGEIFAETEYNPEWDGGTRSLYELMTMAGKVDADRTQAIVERGVDDETVARELWQLINQGGEREQAGSKPDQETAGESPAEQPALGPREVAGGPQEGTGAKAPQPDLTLTPQTPADIAAQNQAEKDRKRQEKAETEKAQADQDVDTFGLTGSEAAVDQAEAQGQENLFSENKPEPPTEPAYAGPDRRKNKGKRKRIDDMTPGEMRKELLIDPLTGLGNLRALDEYQNDSGEPLSYAYVDVDSLKWVNDNMGHASGDRMLAAVGREVLAQTGDVQAFHISGDEFIFAHTDPEQIRTMAEAVRAALDAATVEVTTLQGRHIVKQGIGFSYGIGQTLAEADKAMAEEKQARSEAGLRASRGAKPPRVVEGPAEGIESDQGQRTERPGKAEGQGVSTEPTEPVGAENEQLAQKPLTELADFVRDRIGSDWKITWKQLVDELNRIIGGTQAEGAWNPKDAYDAMELGFNLWVKQQSLDSIPPVGAVRIMEDKQALLPTQTRRDQKTDELQQFSTPHTHSHIAAWVANIGKNDTVLEPSAGTGNLVSHALTYRPAAVIGNELDDRRAGLLGELGIRVERENANLLNATLPKDIKPTVVVMNPPFSADVNKARKKDLLLGAKHVAQALKRLEPGGRLVAILGRGMALDRVRTRKWWDGIGKEYNVRANVTVSGEEYRKFGTAFDNVIVVIDKDGNNTNWDQVVTDEVAKVEHLIPLLEGIRNDRVSAGKQPTAQPSGTTGTGTTESQPDQRPAIQSPTDARGDEGGATTPVSPTASGGSGGLRGPTTGGRSGKRDDVLQGEGESAAATGGAGTPGRGEHPASRTPERDTGTPPERAASGVKNPPKKAPRKKVRNTESVFEAYAALPVIEGAKAHPSPLAESAAMSSMDAPPVDYTPNLPAEIIESGKLSAAQVETIARAGHAHSQTLPDESRRGFFDGDGTGVGKGAQIAGIILDNWRQGRRKAIWVSKNRSLYSDAQRDLEWVGMDKAEGFELASAKQADAVKRETGVMFATYDTVGRGIKKAGDEGTLRLQQIVKWVGEDFDGVLAFDESHLMGNALDAEGERGTKKASDRALAGIELQRQLPKARVVYFSATGATEVMNLAYLDRLGLWGEGTAFADKKSFISQVASGGVAAMEVVAKDLKAMGAYVSRSLSFDGVTYDTLKHKITADQREIYDTLAESWQITLANIEQALIETGVVSEEQANGRARGQELSKFWGAHQRFFNAVLTGMQMPTVLAEIEKNLKNDQSAVLQVVNTNEATQERRAAQAAENDIPLEEMDVSPRDILMQYIELSFPTQQYEEYTDDDGNVRSRPVTDSQGRPVENPEAVARRDELLDQLGSIPVPDSALDQLINHFGPAQVAEVTGRKRRFVRKPDGTVEEEKRGKRAIDADVIAFNDGRKRILIFSDAGGTGKSYHASRDFTNQQKRIHYLLQPGWRADAAIQGTGRTHRTNQAQPPHYNLVTTDLKAQLRFIATIARRLDQLGALTKGQRDTASQGMFSSEMNLENQYGEMATERLIADIIEGNAPGIAVDDFQQQTGIKLLGDDGERLNRDVTVKLLMNRMLSLKTDMMDDVFNAFMTRFNAQVEYAKERGTYDTGMETITAERVTVEEDTAIPGTQSRYVKLALENPAERIGFDDVNQMEDVTYIRNKRSGKLYGIYPAIPVTDTETGRVVKRMRRLSARGGDYINETDVAAKYKKVSDKQEVIRAEWDKAYEEAPKTKVTRRHLIAGVLLPIWDRLPHGTAKIYRAFPENADVVLGREIKPKEIGGTLKALGVAVDVPERSPAQWLDRVLNNGEELVLANGWKIAKRRVSGEKRIEIIGPEYNDFSLLTKMGAFTERHNYKTRVFLPTDKAETLERVFKHKPIIEVIDVGIKELSAVYSGYERDTDNLQVREPTGDEPAQLAFDLQPPPDVPTAKAQLADNFLVHYQHVRTGEVRSGVEKVTKPEHAAHILAPFRKYGQETFVVLVLDKDDRPIHILRHSIGDIDGAQVYANIIAGAIASTEGAAKVYLSHNHPSGDPDPSSADQRMTERIWGAMDGADVELAGHIVLGAGQSAWTFSESDMSGRPISVPPLVRKRTIPVTERMLRRRPPAGRVVFENPDVGKQHVRDMVDRTSAHDAVLLLNNRHQLVGTVYMTPKEMATLREGGQARRMMAALDKTNAAATIIVTTDAEAATNMAKFLNTAGRSRVLDALIYDTEADTIRSSAERGQGIESAKGAFFARDKTPASAPVFEPEAVKKIAQRVAKKLFLTAERSVVATEAQLPAEIRQAAKAQEATGQVRGVFHKGKVYIVASQIQSEAQIEEILLHEGLGHYGARQLFGKRVNQAMANLYWKMGGSKGIRALAEKHGFAQKMAPYFDTAKGLSQSQREFMLADEFLAHAQGEQVYENLPAKIKRALQELWGALRAWLKSKGMVNLAAFSDSDLAYLLRRMAQAAQREDTTSFVQPAEPTTVAQTPAFARAPDKVTEDTSIAERHAAMSAGAGKGARVDKVFRLPFHVVGNVNQYGEWVAPQSWRGAKTAVADHLEVGAQALNQRAPILGEIVETAKAGLVDRYGLSNAYIDRGYSMEAEERRLAMRGADIIDELAKRGVDSAEASVLQSVLNGDAVGDAEMKALAEPIRNAIDDLGQMAVEADLLTREQYEENRATYLHRVYRKHEEGQSDMGRWLSAKLTARRKKIQGNALKGRGIFWEVDHQRLIKDVPPNWMGSKQRAGKADLTLKGKEFHVFDKVAPSGEGTANLKGIEGKKPKGKVTQRVYWPADVAVPAKFEAWESRGKFKVRDTKGGKLTLWRDYTKPEREKMGEIVDARYTIARTFQVMSHDIAVGNFYKDIAKDEDWTWHGQGEPDNAKTATELSYRTYANVDWVKVPDSAIAKTGGKKRWGALAGKYVRSEIWRDLNELDRMNRPGVWQKLMTQWKLNKTARNPVVHMNNIMSNLLFMDMADIRMRDLVAGFEALFKKDADWRDAMEHGAFGSSFIHQEINRNILEPILAEIKAQNMDDKGFFERKVGNLGRFADILAKGYMKYDRGMVNFYQLEDEVFRMATYLRRRSLGDSTELAARTARDQFLNYDIRAPWVNLLRRTGLPFLSYTYRAIPVIAQSIIKRPWKVLKYITIAHALNALAYAFTGDDEDEERRSMDKQKQGNTWLGVPRMLKMPWHDDAGNPVFLDIRRWVPAGDVFDMQQGSSAIPVPAWLQFGGPLMLGAEFALNKTAFTGKEITNPLTDDLGDKLAKNADWAYKSWMPSAFWIPNTWYWEKLGRSGAFPWREQGADRQGRVYTPGQALLSSIGVKVTPHDVMLGYAYQSRDLKARQAAQKTELRANARRLQQNLITENEYERVEAEIKDELETLRERMRELSAP